MYLSNNFETGMQNQVQYKSMLWTVCWVFSYPEQHLF